MNSESYLYSHMGKNKGTSYDERYRTDPWLKYAWYREQEILGQIICDFYKDQQLRVLDFACGTGRILLALENCAASATGIDVSESMLSVARRKLRRSTLVQGNILQKNPLAGERFNLITAFRFFVNAEPELRTPVLAALGSMLTDGGYLVFNSHHNPHSMRWGYCRVAAAVKGDECRVNFLSMRNSRELASRAGLEIVAAYPVGLLHIPRFNLPEGMYHFFDRVGDGSLFMARLSESPVFVCRKVPGHLPEGADCSTIAAHLAPKSSSGRDRSLL